MIIYGRPAIWLRRQKATHYFPCNFFKFPTVIDINGAGDESCMDE
jgi:hypothetical protein